jgi:WD40 repeat protein
LACGLNPGGENIVIRDARTGSRRYLLREVGGVMAFSPDGGRLATLKPAVTPEGRYQQSKTSTCSIWDVKTGELLKVLPGAGINLEFHPDGKRLATATPGYLSPEQSQEQANGLVRILSVEGPSATVEFPSAFSYPIAFSPAGGNVAVCEHTNDTAMIAVFEAQTGRKVNSIGPILSDREHVRVYGKKGREVGRVANTADVLELKHYVCDIAFRPDGQVLATAADHLEGQDNGWTGPIAANDSGTARQCEVKLWDVQTGRELAAIRRRPSTHIKNLLFSPDGRRLAFSRERIETDRERITEVCDAASGQALLKLDGGAPVYSPNGRLLATTGGLWDSRTGEPVRKPGGWFDPGGVLGEPALAFDPAGGRLAAISGGDDGMIKLFAVPSGKLLQVLQSDLGRLESICYTPDGERLISCSREGPIRIWDARVGRCLLTLSSSFASLKDLQDQQNDPLRRAVLISERSLASLQDRQRAMASLQDRMNVPAVYPFYAYTKVAVSADGTCIATTDDNGRVRLWRAAPAKTK